MNPLDELALIDRNFNQDALLKLQQKQQQTAKKKKTGRGGTLTSLISEGGALGGAAAGAAVGSVVPVVGTALGGIIGGTLGAFGGRLAENKVRDDRLGVGDAAKEAAISGVLSGPLKLVKYGGTAAKTAKSGASLDDALKAAAASADKRVLHSMPTVAAGAVSDTAAKTSAKGRLQDLANRALTSQYGTIGKPIARKTNPEGTFGTLATYGLTKPRDVEAVSSAITGSNGILNSAVTKAASQSGQIDVSNLRQILDDAIENNGVVGKDAKELTTMFDAQMKRLYGGPRGTLSPTANPNDVLDVMRSFEKRIAQKTGKGGNYRLATDATVNQANALKLVVDDLRDRLESGANIQQVLTPELRERLIGLNPTNRQWQQFVDGDVMGAKSIQDLRSAQSPFVNARQIIDEADVNSMTFGGRMPQTAGGIKDALVGAITTPFQAPAARAAARTLQGVAGIGTGAPGIFRSGLTGTRMGAQGQIAEGIVAAPAAAPEGEQPVPQEETVDIASAMLPAAQPQASSTGIFDPAVVNANAAKILANGGSLEDVSRYVSIAQALGELGGGNDNGLNSTTATQVAASANATNTLDQLEGLFNTAGGGAGKLGGSLKNALSRAGLEGNVQTYNDLAASSVSQLARALNGGGQVSDADAAVVVQALPKITDSQEVAARKFAALKDRLLAARQNTLLYNNASQPAGLAEALTL